MSAASLLADEHVDDLFNAANNDVLWALTDHLGSVRDAVDSEGNLRLHRRFDAFGNILEESHYDAEGDPVEPGWFGYAALAFVYTGRPLDETTGLQNNLHRWYSASIGRWMSEDPIGFAAGDANLSRYVGNVPTVFIDPKGVLGEEGEYDARQGKGRNPDPEMQLDEIEKAQKRAVAARPQTQGENADADWEGAKRPQQETVRNTDKSQQNARNRRRGMAALPRVPRGRMPRAGAAAGAAAPLALDFGVGLANDLTDGGLGNFLDNTLGSGPVDMFNNMQRLFGSDAGWQWSNIFEDSRTFEDGPPSGD